MFRPAIIAIVKKTGFLFLLLLTFAVKPASAQERVDTPLRYIVNYGNHIAPKLFPVTGRIVGMNLEILKGAAVTNICTGETVKADDNGIYHINAAKGDTLGFAFGRYSPTLIDIKSEKERYNAILMKRKTDQMAQPYNKSEYNKAKREDDDLYKILEKDAKLEGRWNY